MKKFGFVMVATFVLSISSFAGSGIKNSKTNTQNEISGKVVELVNGKKQAVPFVLVFCEGTTITTYTDENGEFSLTVEKIGTYNLRFSHVGYSVLNKEVKIKKNNNKQDHKISKDPILLTQQ